VKVQLIAVGRVRGVVSEAVAEYEQRIRRYFAFEVQEVREEPARHPQAVEKVKEEEGRRVLARVLPGLAIIALDREGESWSSLQLADYLSGLALHGRPGASFLIGGAYGLSGEVLRKADRRLSLSAFTLPHELARLILAEQLYRAGTIARGEPYHKTR
jgi:23S rRNA (pseudouridine1915-N3)-methyltransferase